MDRTLFNEFQNAAVATEMALVKPDEIVHGGDTLQAEIERKRAENPPVAPLMQRRKKVAHLTRRQMWTGLLAAKMGAKSPGADNRTKDDIEKWRAIQQLMTLPRWMIRLAAGEIHADKIPTTPADSRALQLAELKRQRKRKRTAWLAEHGGMR